MRTPFLQYLYLQKPITLVVIICAISVLPWSGIEQVTTGGKPCNAAVAASMLESGNWVLPPSSAVAYHPPMAHWLMAAFSYHQGYVSDFTSRLPSVFAFILLIGCSLMFFGERIKFQEAFISTLLLLTCVETHRAGMTTEADMLFTAFMVLALYTMYRWENKLELKGLPVIIPFLTGCAVLTKGLTSILLPLFIFGTYLLILNKHRLRTILKALLYTGISSLFLPLIWYVAAWKQGGDAFLQAVLAGNAHWVSRFDPLSLMTGFMPWTLFFFFSLFGLKRLRPALPFGRFLKEMWRRICAMEKIKLFSLTALVCIILFCSIFSGEQSVYALPAYPFITLFLAQYALYLTEYRTRVIRTFAVVLLFVIAAVLVASGLAAAHVIDPLPVVPVLPGDCSILSLTGLLFVILFAMGTVIYQLFKRINIKILYATIALIFASNLFIDWLMSMVEK
ncbi:MAG: glycosyltransferase family 39 protein [Tannerellaceae bacterium]|jgi:4-amino-4-deoxy-L-arabinose transferase-like glycosyltransferase|nr:glycosyltransferase family 39 protein [Tannerellaceae bacterium]